MTYEEFATAVAEYFEIQREMLSPYARLVEDLYFDSIMLFELVLMLEDLAGHELDLVALETISTVNDVYLLAEQFIASSSGL